MKKNTSKQKMKECLLELLQKHSIGDITVKELCSVSGYHRSTFYDNYETIYDLYKDVHYDVFGRILELIKDSFFDYSLTEEAMIDVISLYEEDVVLRFLLSIRGNDSLFMVYLVDFFEEHLKLENAEFILKCRFKSQAIAGIIIIREWLKMDKPCSKERLAKLILQHDLV